MTLDEKEQEIRFNRFLLNLDSDRVLTNELETFLLENKKGFFENVVLKEYPSKGIYAGSKMSKSFKRFILDEKTTRYIQDMASRYIQENKIKGYLFLSVDPRDFLTISENKENWTSCQSLDGDFRAGNLNYMVDSTTIVVYLADDKLGKLRCLPPGVEWNSKKWRMLVHTDGENNIYYNRQYPFDSDTLLHKVHRNLINLLGLKNFSEPSIMGFKVPLYPQSITTNQLCAAGRVFDTRDIINAESYLGYSDLIYSSFYSPTISVDSDRLRNYSKPLIKNIGLANEFESFYDIFNIKIGEEAICPCCGENYIKNDHSFLCPYCIAENDADEDFFLTCNSCGSRIYDDEEIFWDGDVPYCKKCYKELEK